MIDVSNMQSETNINGSKFVIYKIGALEAFSMGKDLLKVVAPLFGGSLDGMRDNYSLEAPRTFTDLALVLCDQIDKVGIEDILQRLLRNCTKNGKEITDLNDLDQIQPDELIELFAFALQENFKKLFTGKGIAARLQAVVTGMMADSSDQSQEQ